MFIIPIHNCAIITAVKDLDSKLQTYQRYNYKIKKAKDPDCTLCFNIKQFLVNVTAASIIITSDHKRLNFKHFKFFSCNVFTLVPKRGQLAQTHNIQNTIYDDSYCYIMRCLTVMTPDDGTHYKCQNTSSQGLEKRST
jgi:hypothetical protein